MTGWKDLIGALGVVLSLLFVGFEVRQNTRALQATVRNDLTAASREYLLAQSTSPELSTAYELWASGGESSPVQDRMVMTSTMALIRNIENVYLQAELGTIDSEVVGMFGLTSPIFQSAKFRAFWESSARASVDPGFAEAFDTANGFQGRE
ncbi:MAG: hypothetical protein ACF8LL_05065 [Phycisphaerales bacterium]